MRALWCNFSYATISQPQMESPYMPLLNIGIAITTYNRCDLVSELVSSIRVSTGAPFNIVICDDGSTDNTVLRLREFGETVITGKNHGIAWNKNRGIFYLMHMAKSDVILLLDDDVLPVHYGWENEWMEAAQRFGHVNYSLPDYRHTLIAGECTSTTPGLTEMICGCALAFRHDVLASLGYMDPRFGRYGHEHSDLSIRAVRAGHGGLLVTEGDAQRMMFYVIDGGLSSRQAPTTGTPDEVSANGHLLALVANDSIYRHAWRDDMERAELLSEIAASTGIPITSDNQINSARYLALHQDVATAGADPVEHYLYYGQREGRKVR
jgi:glycosyltransferase involved in cell wall biosynthesis